MDDESVEDFPASRTISAATGVGQDIRLRLLDRLCQLHGHDPQSPVNLLIPTTDDERCVSGENGASLDHCIARTRSDPLRNWEAFISGGMFSLLGQFSTLVRLVAYLQEEGVFMPAIPPDALFLGNDGQLRLRVSKVVLDLDGRLDEYACRIAPEILLSREPLIADESQSVYALGVLIYECASGHPPWSGRGAAEVGDRILSASTSGSIIEEVGDPPGLTGLLRDVLSLDSEVRPATLHGFASMLDAVRDGDRPRSIRNTVGQETRSRRRLMPLMGAIGFFFIAGWIGRSVIEVPVREEVVSALSAGMLARPLPVHGEEEPVDAVGVTLLKLHGDQARHLTSDPLVQVNLAWVALRAGEPALARISARHAIQVDPLRPGPWIVLGIAALEQGDVAGLQELNRGLKLDPIDGFDLWSRGAAQLYLFRFEEAAKTFARITEENPTDADAWLHLTLASLRSGDLDTAAVAIDRARGIDRYDGWADWLSAEVAHASGSDSEARKILLDASSRFVSSPSLSLRIGSLWGRLGEPVRGRDWMRRADLQRFQPPRREWREAGRLVEEGRDLLLLGPPPPPEVKKSSE